MATDRTYLPTFYLSFGHDIVQDGYDVALVTSHSAPKALYLMREDSPMLSCDIIHALQQPLTPIACTFKSQPHKCKSQATWRTLRQTSIYTEVPGGHNNDTCWHIHRSTRRSQQQDLLVQAGTNGMSSLLSMFGLQGYGKVRHH